MVLLSELAVAARRISVPNCTEFMLEAVKVTVGPFIPMTTISDEVVFNPVLSVARALTKFVPRLRLVKTMLNGAVLAEPKKLVRNEFVRTKNSTCAMVPFGLNALAIMVTSE